jgi:ankyrin repeat protein
VKLLLGYGADIAAKNADGTTPFSIAVHKGDAASLALMIQQGADLQYALLIAISQGNVALMDAVLATGVKMEDLNKNGWLPLHDAAQRGLVEITQKLLAAGADVHALNTRKQTALHIAAINGTVAVVSALIQHGANVEEMDRQNETPLHKAAAAGAVEAARFLLDKGANIHALDDYYNTPLLMAAWKGNVQMCELLLSRGAKVDHLNEDYYSVLHMAASHGSMAVIKLLLAAGAPVNAATIDEEMTVLHMVSTLPDASATMKMLLSYGADKNSKDVEGLTAFDYEIHFAQNDNAKFLFENGGRLTLGRHAMLPAMHAGVHNEDTDLLLWLQTAWQQEAASLPSAETEAYWPDSLLSLQAQEEGDGVVLE